MGKMKKQSAAKEGTWKIREYISGLEKVKDEIIEYLETRTELAESSRNLWTADIKECYYSIVAAWQMLSSGSGKNSQFQDSAGNFLKAAESRLAQVSSELTSLDSNDARRLNQEVEGSFNYCHMALSAELERLSAGKKIKKPTQKVIKVEEWEYHLPCSVCGEIAVKFKIGRTRFDKEDSLVFSGITFSRSLDRNLAPQLFKHLEQENLSRVHTFMKKHYKREGLDAYCPKCGKIYCSRHYQTREEYDEGYYDCTYGTCPHGHKRIIHD
jgi:deoxycytidylate deaminase